MAGALRALTGKGGRLIVTFVLLGCSLAAQAQGPGAEDLAAELEPIRAKHELPALAAAAMVNTSVAGSGAVGVRKAGGQERVTIDDLWHVGSITKSMTATLAGMFVTRGEIKWQSTVSELLPDLADTMDPAWKSVTLEQLLTHRGGAPGEPPPNLWRVAQARRGTPEEQRHEFVRGLLLRRPEVLPGSEFIYSNYGYSIAGAMLEQVGGQPWETLLRTMLFPTCMMVHAGFGAPATPGKVDQPWGHRREEGKLIPVPPGPGADNPPAIGPAGTVHCTILELARYAALHARGEQMGAAGLKRETFVRLHTPVPGGDYAMGWRVVPRDWAHGNALTHNGSNTMFYAAVWIAPARNMAFVAATNCAGAPAEAGCDEAVAGMIMRFAR